MCKIPAAAAMILAAAAIPSGGASAAILGPEAARCAPGAGPAMLVRVTGFKNRAGTVRVRSFPGATPAAWFDRKRALKRHLIALPDGGPVEICVAVARPGPYVIDVRHDINGNGDSDRADGAGVSGNPNVSVFDFFVGKKPPASVVVVNVGAGVTIVPVTMKYIQGGSFRPVRAG